MPDLSPRLYLPRVRPGPLLSQPPCASRNGPLYSFRSTCSHLLPAGLWHPGTLLSFGTCCSLCLDHPSQHHFPGKLRPVLKVSCESLAETCCQGPWAGRCGDAFHAVGMWFLPLVCSTNPSSHLTGLLGDGRERDGFLGRGE